MKMENQELRRWLYHRPPFLLVDRVVELIPRERAVGIKCVSALDPYFQGHFPDNPIFPGVLLIEALAQLAAVGEGYLSAEDLATGRKPPMGYMAQIKDFKFKRMIRPGDVIHLEVVFERRFANMVRVRGTARVEDQVAAEGILMFALEEVE